MKKNVYLCIDLKAVMQKEPIIKQGQCYKGVLSRDSDDHFRFEETVTKPRAPHRPKLYEGQFISMTRLMSGKYKLNLKNLDPTVNREHFAFNVYSEITDALRIID